MRSLHVVEALSDVIAWHRDAILPMAVPMNADPRCQLVEGDFFAMVASTGFGRSVPAFVDAILLDIDHTPRHVLHPSHADFYTAEGLRRLASMLRLGGVFALWSDEPPDEDFMAVLSSVFSRDGSPCRGVRQPADRWCLGQHRLRRDGWRSSERRAVVQQQRRQVQVRPVLAVGGRRMPPPVIGLA